MGSCLSTTALSENRASGQLSLPLRDGGKQLVFGVGDDRCRLPQRTEVDVNVSAEIQPHDDYCVTPGLTQAAISAIDASQPEPVLSLDETTTILHHRASQYMAQQALRVARHLAFMPVLTHAICIHRPQAGSMAHQWVMDERLIDVPDDRRTELGYRLVSDYARGARPVRWLADRLNPHIWVIQTDAGAVFAGVGTTTPRAAGRLIEAEIGNEACFFRDEKGCIWPLPDAGYDYYRTGYEGGGPQRLAETVTTLLQDATADVYTAPTDFSIDTELYRMVTQRRAPFTLTAQFPAAQLV